MCKLSNLYVVDLYTNTGSGGIEWNVANSLPQLINNPCKIVVRQLTTELHDNTPDINNANYLRVVHNINIQSGSNKSGFSNSNTLAFIDSFQVRTIDAQHMIGFTSTNCVLYAPNGLPALLTLNKKGDIGLGDVILDDATFAWSCRLEITINPDQE
jgi:hypothetical protein